MTHQIDYRVYYEDTDAGGVVYHANFLKFAERARTEMIRAEGLSNQMLRDDHNCLVVVRHIEIDYAASGFLEDMLTVESSIEAIGRTSFTMKQVVMREGQTLATLIVKLVCVDAQTWKPVRVPDILRGVFEG